MTPAALHHFSEDPNIERFVPHVPATNPEHPASVWAIDTDHSPLYWFPRDCPRVTVWPWRPDDIGEFREAFTTRATRVHGIESRWLATMRRTDVYRYDLPVASFVPSDAGNGQWISASVVEPIAVTPVGDLLDRHAEAGIELRATPSLWPLHDLAADGRWNFSMVRMRNALPRDESLDAADSS